MTGRELTAPGPINDRELDTLFRVSKALAMSGLFKDVRQAEQALAKVMIGRDLGLSPTVSLMGINLIEGKPELSANLQASFVKQMPGYDFKVTEHTVEACEIAFYRDGEELGRSRFTMDDARTAGLAGRGPWKSYPRNMLWARALTNGVAFHVPEVTGGIRVYSEGEISGEEQPRSVGAVVEATTGGSDLDVARSQAKDSAPADPSSPPAPLEPIDAVVVEEPPEPALLSSEQEATVRELIELAVSECRWSDKRTCMAFGAYGATDIATVESAIRSLPAAGVDGLIGWISDCVNVAVDERLSEEEAKS